MEGELRQVVGVNMLFIDALNYFILSSEDANKVATASCDLCHCCSESSRSNHRHHLSRLRARSSQNIFTGHESGEEARV